VLALIFHQPSRLPLARGASLFGFHFSRFAISRKTSCTEMCPVVRGEDVRKIQLGLVAVFGAPREARLEKSLHAVTCAGIPMRSPLKLHRVSKP
jgi:hypothetical protein